MAFCGTLGLWLAPPDLARAQATILGPKPYTSLADSPFDTTRFGFCVEDFEDGTFDVPGATESPGMPIGPSDLTDSVDADDGSIDGSGTGGHSFRHVVVDPIYPDPVVIDFDRDGVNGLPTEVGIVWTDGHPDAEIVFAAFDRTGQGVTGRTGPHDHADGGNDGRTDEDRFYGVTDPRGVARIVLAAVPSDFETGNIEFDHLQMNHCILCGDADADLERTASDALSVLNVSVGLGTCNRCVCDADGDLETSVVDAAVILQSAVGLGPTLACPPCERF